MPEETHVVSPDESDPRSSTTVIVGVVGVALTVVIVILLEVLFQTTAESEFQRKVVSQQSQELQGLRATQLEQLNGYRWVDQNAGVATIPIERAMELVVRDSGSRNH